MTQKQLIKEVTLKCLVKISRGNGEAKKKKRKKKKGVSKVALVGPKGEKK